MSLSIDELFRELTEAEVRESFLSIFESIGIPARSWRLGGVASTMVTVLARTYAGYTGLNSRIAKLGFLDSSDGSFLRLLAEKGYGVTPRDATFATGSVTLANASGGLHSVAPGEAVFLNPSTKKRYTNTSAFTLAPLSSGVSVDVQCTEAGAAGTSFPGTVTALETVLLGVTCTNPTAIVGSDPATKEEIVALCRAKAASRSPNGPADAYNYFARTALRLDGTLVDINRVSVTRNTSTGTVVVSCASPSGTPSAGDLLAIKTNIEKNCLPDSVTLIVQGVTTVVASFPAVQIWARTDGSTTAEVLNAASAALVELEKSYPIGGLRKNPSAPSGSLYADRVASAVIASHPSIFDVDGISSDVSLAIGQVVQIVAGITVNQVSDGVS